MKAAPFTYIVTRVLRSFSLPKCQQRVLDEVHLTLGNGGAHLKSQARAIDQTCGMATRQWAIEVPLCQFDACHTLDVPGDGTPRFALPVLTEGDACAGKSKVYQGSIASRCLVWQLDAAKPAQLLLRDVGVSEERREGSVCLFFASSLLPCVSCTESVQHGGTLVAVVTADGTLHTIRHSTGAAASTGSLASQLRAPGAMASVSLAAHFQRAGPPTAVLEVGGFICIGTSEGNLVCLPATSTDPADVFPLAPMSSLGKVGALPCCA
jgi:hypothetical protein